MLSAVNGSIYLTTNYDDFMLMALLASRREAVKDFCRWTPTLLSDRSALAANFQPSPEHALVYHLHGHADEPRSIVVTEDDYLDFTVQVTRDLARSKGHIGQNVMLPGYVRKAITNNLLLFVGYSVRDQNLRVVLRTLWQALTPASDRLNIANQLRLEPGVTGADIDRIKTYLERHYEVSLKLQVYWGEAREFAAELRKRL